MEHLPNEILSIILKKIDIAELILLRRVNKRWQAVIESLPNSKRSLFLTNWNCQVYCGIESLWLDKKDFMLFKLDRGQIALNMEQQFNLSADFCALIHRMLPNLEVLVIDIVIYRKYVVDLNSLLILFDPWVSQLKTLSLTIYSGIESQFAVFWDEIYSITCSMPALKQLAIHSSWYIFNAASAHRLASTLGRLERFSARINSFEALSAVASNLGASCTHLNIYCNELISVSQIRQCCDANQQIWSNLTHLHLKWIQESKGFDILCQYMTSLRVLNVTFFCKVRNCLYF